MAAVLKNLRGDLFGGITAGIVALPLALAFGIYTGMGAEAGLYGAIMLGFFAALFGGTDTQVSGPTGPMSVITALLVGKAIALAGSLDAALGLILFTFMLAGFFQIVLGFMRVGQYIKYIPYPVISGFMTGIGVIIVLLQFFPLVGLTAPASTTEVIMTFHKALLNIHWPSLGLGLATIAIIYSFPYITRFIPSQLIALLAVTGAAVYWQIPGPTIGSIPSGLPHLQLDKIFSALHFQHYEMVIISALTLAALGMIDSLLTSVVADNMTKTKHNSTKELIGQGIGNIISALFGGIPGASATMRTVINIKSGGRTKLSGMIHSVFLLLILVALGDYAAKIPLAVLAGILMTVGFNIIDYKGLKHIHHIPFAESFVMLIVFAMTVFVSLIQAVIVGFVLSSVLFMKRISDINEQRTFSKNYKDMLDNTALPDENIVPTEIKQEIYVKHLYGPLFFGFTSHFQDLIIAVPKVKHVVLRMGKVPYIDQSGVYAIEDALLYLQGQGITVHIVDIQSQPLDMLKRIKIVPDLIDESHFHNKFKACIGSIVGTLLKP